MKKIIILAILFSLINVNLFATSKISIQVNDKLTVTFNENVNELKLNKEHKKNLNEMVEFQQPFDESFLVLSTDLKVGFFTNDCLVNLISYSSSNFILIIDDYKFKFDNSSSREIEAMLGFNHKVLSDDSFEYSIDTDNPLIQNYLRLYFNNDKCIKIEIYDTSLFI